MNDLSEGPRDQVRKAAFTRNSRHGAIRNPGSYIEYSHLQRVARLRAFDGDWPYEHMPTSHARGRLDLFKDQSGFSETGSIFHGRVHVVFLQPIIRVVRSPARAATPV